MECVLKVCPQVQRIICVYKKYILQNLEIEHKMDSVITLIKKDFQQFFDTIMKFL